MFRTLLNSSSLWLFIVVVSLIVVALQPSEVRGGRTASISAPPAAVFAQMNDFHKWEACSSWAKLDPAAKNTFKGTSAGIGAVFTWSGNSKVSEGRMTNTDSHPSDLIRIKRDFIRPFPSTSTAEFTFKLEGSHTAATWSMAGPETFMSKAVGLFMNMDKMLGGDFERGLANVKSVTEMAAKR